MNSKAYINIWAERYAQYKNAIIKGDFNVKNELIELKSGAKTITYTPMADLNILEKAEDCIIITYNTKENFERLIKNWNKLVDKKITLIMINPFSKLDDKWTVVPHIHQKICEKSSFKRALKTMFESVETITEEQINKLNNSDE